MKTSGMSNYPIVLEDKFTQSRLMSGGLSHVRLGTTSNVPSIVIHSVVVTEMALEI